ncbi:MAG TPA: recombinase family protein, partial [Candidatus Dojkabacteria bacterium]
MKRAIILARVSTKEQEETGLSIGKIQLPQMREYAKNNDLEVVAEYVFQETASGKLRKKFDEMIKAVKESSDIKAIISYRVDRLTRNFRDAVAMDDLRKDYDKELHFVSDRLVLTKDSYGNDIANWDFQVFIAKQHINNCERHAYDNLKNKLDSGESYGRAPYGYKNINKEESKKHPELERVVIDTFEAGIVKKVFDLYTTGADSYLSIAKKLLKEYPSEFKALKTVRRRVEHIIKNP